MPDQFTSNSSTEHSGELNTPATNASAIVEQAKQDLSTVGREASDVVATVKVEAEKHLGHAKEGAESFVGEQKDVVARQLAGIAGALSKTSTELQAQQPAVAEYTQKIARSIEGVSEQIKDHDVKSLVRIAEDFGRRQPATMLSLAALAGFLSGRVLLASSQRSEPAPASVTPARRSGGTP